MYKSKHPEQDIFVEDDIKEKTNRPLSTGKYRIVYADPPWQYGDKLVDGYGAAEHHYGTMSLEDICNLKIQTEDNAVLFLWVTSPILEDAFKVIKAWGFKYKSSFVWDKIDHNYAHYNSLRHEFLLVSTKGSCLPDRPKLYPSVVSMHRGAHSQKPHYFRKMIDYLYPIGNRIELFARKKYEKWDVWGNKYEYRIDKIWNFGGKNRCTISCWF
jgi:site-specific DNA-methyltransferase (adenine-specific)